MHRVFQIRQCRFALLPITHASNQRLQRRPGTVLVGRNGLDAVLDVASGGGTVAASRAHQTAQIFKLVAQGAHVVRGKQGLDMGLDLAHNAAHILAPGDMTFIAAVFHQAAGSAHDAAQIVANVRIAHFASIDAVYKASAGVSGNAAGILRGIRDAHIRGLGKVQIEVQVDILNIHCRIHALGIHGHTAAAGKNRAVIVAHNAAGVVFSGDAALGCAVCQGAFTSARHAANIGLALYRAGKGAVFQGTVVFAHDAAGVFPVSFRSDSALNIQVLHHCGGLKNTEQAGRRDTPGHIQIPDGMAAAVKAAAEGGDGFKIRSLQGNICQQINLHIPGPGVQGAVFCKFHQILRRADGNNANLYILRFRRRRQRQKRQQKKHQNAGR